jgi:hypothetical protein
MQPVVFFNSNWSTLTEQIALHSLMPKEHEFGDRKSILSDSTVIEGPEAHGSYVDRALRIKTRKRSTLVTIKATHMGFGRYRKPTNAIILCCFTAVTDWEAPFLDAETFFLFEDPLVPIGPKIGPYNFAFSSYIGSLYEDIVMSLMILKTSSESVNAMAQTVASAEAQGPQKVHLKIVPLGVGPFIKTKYGDNIGPYLSQAYLIALQYACNVMLNSSWIDTLEFVDFTKGLSPYLHIQHLKIITTSRDVLDYTGSTGIPALLAPCDAFLKIGHGEKSIVSTIAKNSNLLECMAIEPHYVSWPK